MGLYEQGPYADLEKEAAEAATKRQLQAQMADTAANREVEESSDQQVED